MNQKEYHLKVRKGMMRMIIQSFLHFSFWEFGSEIKEGDFSLGCCNSNFWYSLVMIHNISDYVFLSLIYI